MNLSGQTLQIFMELFLTEMTAANNKSHSLKKNLNSPGIFVPLYIYRVRVSFKKQTGTLL